VADGLTLPDLLAELARNGLRVASVTMAGGHVAAFTAVPAGDSAPASRSAAPAEEEAQEPDALETFVNRKGLKK
jgi:hypothetical protein